MIAAMSQLSALRMELRAILPGECYGDLASPMEVGIERVVELGDEEARVQVSRPWLGS